MMTFQVTHEPTSAQLTLNAAGPPLLRGNKKFCKKRQNSESSGGEGDTEHGIVSQRRMMRNDHGLSGS